MSNAPLDSVTEHFAELDDPRRPTSNPRRVEGALVTVDAPGRQTKIAGKIVEKGADYLLAVKEDQPTLCQTIGDAFPDSDKERLAERLAERFADYAEHDNKQHGRDGRLLPVGQERALAVGERAALGQRFPLSA